ncbi:hypothetical protein FAEPRAA2165_01733 [Faecalibacterium duncaniae]|uniref:Uncharacterized protein n=1 Tax=Faecalibacterium duncaniae (strain DSM 17677 / JCM 31915 / A2-165) TaxID=411483 RepID=C7H608_FAED2|nr:hypothetical protein FAEPRAA2165_01733 [Faecalibacterium duncaniae]
MSPGALSACSERFFKRRSAPVWWACAFLLRRNQGRRRKDE